MANWWKSIRDRGSQIKGGSSNWGREGFIVAVLILTGISAFGLGRLSNFEEQRPAIRMREQAQVEQVPIAIGGKIVASRKGSKYHYPWCSGAQTMNESNKIWFDSEEEARAAGYTPAGNCKGLR